MSTSLNVLQSEPAGFSLGQDSDGVTVDELSKDAMGGTEMMKYGLYERLPIDIRDEVQISFDSA